MAAKGISVINVTTPSAPALVTTWTAPAVEGQRFAVDVQRSVLYRIADDGFVLYAYNISDLKNPVPLSTTTWSAATGTPFLPTLSLSGNLLVASASDNVGLINVKDPAHPILLRSQPGITSITPRNCKGGERGTPDVLAFQQDGGYYFARIRTSDGDIVKVESCQFQGVSAGPCVRFETTYFNTSNDPDCKYPVNKSKPYDCSLNNDPWIPRDYGGEVWTLGGKRYLIDANGGYYMRAFTLDNPARPVRIAYARLFTDQIWTLRVMYPFGGFSVLDDDPIGYARYGFHGYVIFKFVPPSVTRLYQYDLWPSGDYFMNGKLVKVGGVRYLVGLLSTNEQSTTKWSTTSAWAGSDTLSGISIYRLGDDGMPRPLAFLEYHWLRVSPFWVYQALDGDPFLYTYPTDIYGNPLPGNGLAAWNLSDPSNPTGPILLHDQNGQPFTNYRFVFDEAERKAYAFIANGTQYSIVAYDWSNPVSPKRLGEFNFTVYNSSIEYFSSLSARDGLVYTNFFTNYASPSFSVSALLVSFADPAHPKAIPDQDGVLRSLAYNGGGSDILHDAATGRYYVYRSNYMTADVISVDEACVANPSG